TSLLVLALCLARFFVYASPSPEIYSLSLHDALPICSEEVWRMHDDSGLLADLAEYGGTPRRDVDVALAKWIDTVGGSRSPLIARSEEHTSELQSRENLVCRLLLEKKKRTNHPCRGGY